MVRCGCGHSGSQRLSGRRVITVAGQTYITATEAPSYLGADVAPATVRQWGSRRKVNRYPVGGETYYALIELAEVERVTRTAKVGRPRVVAT